MDVVCSCCGAAVAVYPDTERGADKLLCRACRKLIVVSGVTREQAEAVVAYLTPVTPEEE